jgi:phosphoglycolate phosphatase
MMAPTLPPPPWTSVLFDLDGTLLDTRPGISSALAAALEEVIGTAETEHPPDISRPLDEMITSALPDLPDGVRREIAAAFRREYDKRYWSRAVPYPGAEPCLRRLREAGVRLFVVTNKRQSSAMRLLDRFGLAGYLEAVIAQPDSGPALPKRRLVDHCLELGALEPGNAVLVGDSDRDAEAAAASNIAFIAVTSGAGPLGHWPDGTPRVEVASLEDAAASVLALRPGRNV